MSDERTERRALGYQAMADHLRAAGDEGGARYLERQAQRIATAAAMNLPDEIDAMIAAGWIERRGNRLVVTDKGHAALRRGVPGHDYRIKHQGLSITSTAARTKKSIKKKSKRR